MGIKREEVPNATTEGLREYMKAHNVISTIPLPGFKYVPKFLTKDNKVLEEGDLPQTDLELTIVLETKLNDQYESLNMNQRLQYAWSEGNIDVFEYLLELEDFNNGSLNEIR